MLHSTEFTGMHATACDRTSDSATCRNPRCGSTCDTSKDFRTPWSSKSFWSSLRCQTGCPVHSSMRVQICAPNTVLIHKQSSCRFSPDKKIRANRKLRVASWGFIAPLKRVQHGCTVAVRAGAQATYEWTGFDQFSSLDDRKNEGPLPLPLLTSPKRIVLLRHGQSTWNAEGRIQGSTDFAVLSEKGKKQAQTACDMVRFCL
jgi:hypothetical protein